MPNGLGMGTSRPPFVARFVFAAWCIGTAYLIWLMLVFPNVREHNVQKDFVVELPADVSLDGVTQQLLDAKISSRPLALKVYLRFMGVSSRLRSGFVVLNRGLSVYEHLPRIAKGFGTSMVHVLVPEGFNRFDTATRLARFGVASRESLLAATEHPELLKKLNIQAESLEGYLFPAVYNFLQGTAADAVVSRMVRVYRERTYALFDAYALAHDGAPFSLTPHELLTLASIVEKEARIPEEREVIAGVFMNRLTDKDFRPKRLQADPTVAYGCLVARDEIPSCSEYKGRVTPAMVRDPANPYSTYRRDGLPPGPICSPGLKAIKATLSPAQHDYFYFVTKGGGRHSFSRSLDDHNLRVRESP